MYVCYLCGLTVDRIPDDAIKIGRLHKFSDGTFHWLRKKNFPRISLEKYRRNQTTKHQKLDRTRKHDEPI
jgi:hypothetical protein